MRGPTLHFSVDLLSGAGDASPLSPDEAIRNFKEEILEAIHWKEFERLEDEGTLPRIERDAEIVALYLARAWHFESPWWCDEALRKTFVDGLQITKAIENSHAFAADLRMEGKGQSIDKFQRQVWEDHAFFLVAAMRQGEINADEASRQAARWRDDFSAGNSTVMASTIERNFPSWAKESLRGKVWCDQLAHTFGGLSPAERADLIQRHKLLFEMLPACPEGLEGARR